MPDNILDLADDSFLPHDYVDLEDPNAAVILIDETEISALNRDRS